MVVIIVALGIGFLAALVSSIYFFIYAKKKNRDFDMEGVRLIGSSYKDVKKRYLK